MTSGNRHPVPAGVLKVFSDLCRDTGTLCACWYARHAARAGRSVTDQQTLNLAVSYAPVSLTAGRIAKLVGMSTGGVTGVLDRLERAGLVRRTADGGDRRKVLVEVLPVADGALRPGPAALSRVLERFSPAERDVVVRFGTELRQALHAELLGEAPVRRPAGAEPGAPLG